MRRLTVGIIGLGVGEQHIAGYRRHPACNVTVLCDFSEDKRAMAREKYPDIRVTGDAATVLSDPAVDIVSIASYDDYHYAQIVAGIHHGKHLFVEKPLCLHEHELVHIGTLLRQNPGLKLSSNLILRMCPRFRNLRSRIRQGALGRLYYIEGDYQYGRIHKIHDGWRGKIPCYSVMLGGGVHMVDLLLWLTGDRVTEVAAFGTDIASRGSRFRHDDTVVAMLRFASGMVGKVAANFPCVHPHFHGLAVYGTTGTFINGADHALLHTSRSAGAVPEVIRDPYPGTHKGDLIYSFVESILHDTDPEVSADDVFDAMRVCFAIEQAARTGAVVTVVSDEGFRHGTRDTLRQADYRQPGKAGCA